MPLVQTRLFSSSSFDRRKCFKSFNKCGPAPGIELNKILGSHLANKISDFMSEADDCRSKQGSHRVYSCLDRKTTILSHPARPKEADSEVAAVSKTRAGFLAKVKSVEE